MSISDCSELAFGVGGGGGGVYFPSTKKKCMLVHLLFRKYFHF